MPVRAPHLTPEKLREIAESFLHRHHSGRTLPIPIESIVEYDFGIDIVPVPGLKNLIDIDSYPTGDLKEIHVDEFVYNNRENRYRFSLAHEVAHLVLHRSVFEELKYSTIDEWKSVVVSGIPPEEYRWIEWQAYTLAGLILVPPAELKATFEFKTQQAHGSGLTLEEITADDSLRNIIESAIADDFVVSSEVIGKRMKADKLWE